MSSSSSASRQSVALANGQWARGILAKLGVILGPREPVARDLGELLAFVRCSGCKGRLELVQLEYRNQLHGRDERRVVLVCRRCNYFTTPTAEQRALIQEVVDYADAAKADHDDGQRVRVPTPGRSI